MCQQNKLSFAVLGFRKTIVDGTKKIVLRGRACSKTLKDYFVCNSRKAILNPHTPKNEVFAESFWCRFFQKAAVLKLYSKQWAVVEAEFSGRRWMKSPYSYVRAR